MSKLPDVGTTIFTVMSKLAVDHHAINLAQGFPDFPIDDRLKEALKKEADNNVHQYQPMVGSTALLTVIGEKIHCTYKRAVNPLSELLITAGATQAIFTTIQALVFPGDEVIILDPSYDCYAPAVLLAGGIPVHIDLNNNYSPPWEKIASAVTRQTRLLIFNNPHNPSGTIWKEADFRELEDLCIKHPRLLLLSDEVYEFITFEQEHISINERQALQDRTIIVSSFGKTFHITGWKVGYLVAPEQLMVEIKKVHQFNVFSVNSVCQAALANYVPQSDYSELSSLYKQKRDLFQGLLRASKFKLLACEGTYFQLADYSLISDLPDTELCKYLVKEVGVAAIPVSVFNKSGKDEKVIRLCFAKRDETLINAANLLCQL